VERDEAIERLPVVYQKVLAWLDEGWSGDRIAARLGIEREAVLPLIRLAEAKLARLTEEPTDGDDSARQ
jgi:hypothetical protein